MKIVVEAAPVQKRYANINLVVCKCIARILTDMLKARLILCWMIA